MMLGRFNRSGPANLLSGWAHGLCARGHTVLRFDFRGSGESSGRFVDTTFAGMTSDTLAFGRFVRDLVAPETVIVAGISIGGVAAALASPGLGADATLLMPGDLLEDVRFAPAGAVPVRSGEFHLPATFFRERERLRPRTVLADRGRSWRLIYGDQEVKLVKAAAQFAALGADVRAIPGTDHLFPSTPARARLLELSAEFVELVAAGARPE